MDGWKTILSYWGPGYFQGRNAVSFREYILDLLRPPPQMPMTFSVGLGRSGFHEPKNGSNIRNW